MNNIANRNRYSLVDPFFDDFFNDERNQYGQMMRTDITDHGDHYEMKIELPDVKKEDIHLSLEDGYLTIHASFNHRENEHEHHKVIRRERYSGSYERSFSVGTNVTEADIKARLENGILTLCIKKPEVKEAPKKYISIE
jgi:hypothetical protein